MLLHDFLMFLLNIKWKRNEKTYGKFPKKKEKLKTKISSWIFQEIQMNLIIQLFNKQKTAKEKLWNNKFLYFWKVHELQMYAFHGLFNSHIYMRSLFLNVNGFS